MRDNTPGTYNGMTHAEAKRLAAEVREQLHGEHEPRPAMDDALADNMHKLNHVREVVESLPAAGVMHEHNNLKRAVDAMSGRNVADVAQTFEPIHRRVIVIVLDDNDRSVSIGVTAHVGASVETEFTHRIEPGNTSASVGFLAGQIVGMASRHQGEGRTP
jgi:hypothetical protein